MERSPNILLGHPLPAGLKTGTPIALNFAQLAI
jgi:hypothetical protein